MKASHILGMNARNHLYLARYNRKSGKRVSDSKLATKKFLKRLKLPHPRLIAVFRQSNDVVTYDWEALSDDFVVKPTAGYAGEGIVIVRRRLDQDRFQLVDGSRISQEDLKLHVLDILAGRFDKYDLPGTAMIEERVVKHPRFRRYAYRGTPDIRIIVFNRVPVLAMLRLPTAQSKGRANLHQGAIGVGVDLASGITTRAVRWDRPIWTVPDTKLKLNGLTIPSWDRMLELAVEAQDHIALGYLAVDFLLDPEKGPLIVELTARPGLSIQIANMAGLRRRIERVEGLDILPGKGIEVAKALFAERFADKVVAERGVKIVGVFETALVRDGDRKKQEVKAKLDTGAYRTSIDRELAEQLQLLNERSILYHDQYWSSLGRERRPVIPITFWLSGRKIETTTSVADRSKLKEKLLVGRHDLSTFIIKVNGE